MAHREVVSNAVENIAFRLAEKGDGTLAPAELLPYLPVSPTRKRTNPTRRSHPAPPDFLAP